MLALGSVILAKDSGRVLLGRRAGSTYAGKWSFFGGKPEAADGNLGDTLYRELAEELGGPVPGVIESYPLDEFRAGRLRYASFVTVVAGEWEPELNEAEHDAWTWTEIGSWPEPLHPGAAAVLGAEQNLLKLKKIRKKYSPEAF